MEKIMTGNLNLMSQKQKSKRVELITDFMQHFSNPSAAIVLSQIQHWYNEGKGGKPKLRVMKNGMFWLAKSSADFSRECGLSAKAVDHAIKELIAQGIIEVEVFRFNCIPMRHIRIIEAEGKASIDHDFTLPQQYRKATAPLEV